MEVVSGDNWSYSIRRAMLQSNRHHQQTNIQLFTIDAIPDAQPTALKHWRVNHYNVSFRNKINEKSAQRDANTARAGCSKVRTPPAHPPVTHLQTGPITIHCAAS